MPSPVLSFVEDFFDWPALDDITQDNILKVIVGYILQISTFSELKSAVIEHLPTARTVTRLRSYCINNWNLNVALRLAIYNCIATKANADQAVVIFRQWQLYDADVEVYSNIVLWRHHTKLRRIVKNLQQPIPKPQELIDNCESVMNSTNMVSFIGKFIYRKLRSFAESNRFSLADFEQDLFAKGVQCYYSSVPNLSKQHTINYVKKAIKYRGHSLISYYAADCRTRLVKWDTSSGFTNTLRDISGLTDSDISLNPIQTSLTNLDSMELWITYQRALDRASVGQRKALSMMTLENNSKFLAWYNFYYRRSCDSTHDIFLDHDSTSAYFDTVRAYLGISSHQFNSWLQRLAS
jgi:hypothetical protein